MRYRDLTDGSVAVEVGVEVEVGEAFPVTGAGRLPGG
jgi:hypothetical protein